VAGFTKNRIWEKDIGLDLLGVDELATRYWLFTYGGQKSW
jgi:hypothetical protein